MSSTLMPRAFCPPSLLLLAVGEETPAAHVELNFIRQLDDGFGMLAVLEQGIFDRLRAINEEAAKKTALFLGDPLASAVSPYEAEIGQGNCTREAGSAPFA